MIEGFRRDGADLPYIIADPVAVLDYGEDWSEWLDGDTIESSTWSAVPTLALNAPQINAGQTSAFISGFDAAQGSYVVRNEISTAGGRTDARSFRIVVRTR